MLVRSANQLAGTWKINQTSSIISFVVYISKTHIFEINFDYIGSELTELK